ncbi:YwqG family protein [Streptomyces sp. ACA25]|uniref:YwqG family protein n=1 Tax=Streptomyces sp. ACA25 TaxID=3022596 RepID=UPI002307480C|nr:YwqG family protein [Streptomyces sp. ACA25]MDB1088779.1 YwqG family protein [Streptomyces sp. ACA25]
MVVTEEALAALASRHLPAEAADRWTALLRPAARLVTGPSPGERAVGRLGGLPRLPADVEWPVWEGHGPLSFVASLDCAALPTGELDIPLPGSGTLLFFWFDGRADEHEACVDYADPATRDGARVLYLPAGTVTAERPAPPGPDPYPARALAARVEPTAGDPTAPALHLAFAPGDAVIGLPYEHPVCEMEFAHALNELRLGPEHQVGGHGRPVISAVELWASRDDLGIDWDDPRLLPDAGEWLLLAQFDSDAETGMEWADGGVIYWTMRREDLAAGRFDRAMFTWQSG